MGEYERNALLDDIQSVLQKTLREEEIHSVKIGENHFESRSRIHTGTINHLSKLFSELKNEIEYLRKGLNSCRGERDELQDKIEELKVKLKNQYK